MNAMDRDMGGEAVLHYGLSDFAVLKPGRYVVCAVSKKRIPLEALHYFNGDAQEAYAGPAEALTRWKQLNGRG